MNKLLLVLALVYTLDFSFAATIVVTNTNNSGAGSFRQAVADANMGDIIRFDPALISGGSVTLGLTSQVSITKGLFIKGLYNSNDTLYFASSGLAVIFDVNMASGSSFANLDLDSIVCENALYGVMSYRNDYFESGTLFIRNSVFKNNQGHTGAVIACNRSGSSSGSYKCNMFIQNSNFINNTAIGSNGGGAIYAYMHSSSANQPEVNIQIENSNFIGNSTSGDGGAIYARAYSNSASYPGICQINITRSTFDNNSSSNYGGAIYAYSYDSYSNYNSSSSVTCNYSTVSRNSATSNGGAFFLESTNTSELISNYSTLYANTCFLDGSLCYLTQSTSTNIIENRANVEIISSVIAENGGNMNYNNTIFQSGYHKEFNSDAYNFFDFPQSHLQDYNEFSIEGSDLFDMTSTQLDLAALSLNANGTYTMIPNEPSVLVNSGAYWITDDAQNGPTLGVRDAGAAESSFCDPINQPITASTCQGTNYNFYGQMLSAAGTYTHTVVTPGACDTIVTLTLTIEQALTPTISITANPGNTIMTGTPVTITTTINNGGTSPTYQWLADGSPFGPNAASILSSNLTDGLQISCVLTSNDGCVTTQTATSNTITFTVHPNNDEPCYAISLPVNTTCVTEYFANHIASNTPNVGAHSCASSTSRDIWFSFIAPATGSVDIFTYAGTLLDAVMSVYLGDDCSSLFEAGCVDDDGANQMPQGVVTGATPGTVYYIRVSSYGNNASGNFGICVVERDPAGLETTALEIAELFPNPNDGHFTLKFAKAAERNIRIYSLTGTLVYEQSTGALVNKMMLENISNGMYQLVVQEGNQSYFTKISIIR